MIVEAIKHALMITSFVFVMMLIIEYVNVQTRGQWQDSLKKHRWMQYIFSAFLGATPGCLGAFTVVAPLCPQHSQFWSISHCYDRNQW